MSETGRQRRYSVSMWIASVTPIQAMSKGKAPYPCDVGRATGFFYKKDEDKNFSGVTLGLRRIII